MSLDIVFVILVGFSALCGAFTIGAFIADELLPRRLPKSKEKNGPKT